MLKALIYTLEKLPKKMQTPAAFTIFFLAAVVGGYAVGALLSLLQMACGVY